MNWADDPELIATFRAEVQERLASLSAGLLRLEEHPSPRQLASLFRDAHTVKGSARMLGLEVVVTLAHRSEDLLGQLRDGRLTVRRDLVDVLLVASEAIGRSLPGAERPVPEGALHEIVAALDAALAGTDPIVVPRLSAEAGLQFDEADLAEEVALGAARIGENVRVPTRRVHALLDVVGEADLEVRRVQRQVGIAAELVLEQQVLARRLRVLLQSHDGLIGSELADTAIALVSVGDRLHTGVRDLKSRGEDASAKLARVRDGAMGLAMVPVRRVVAGFPGLVREIATATGKDVSLHLVGAEVELDVRVLDGVADALRHLVTNAIDHGCETPAERQATGKDRTAKVTVTSRQAGPTIVLQVSDDGHGIDDDTLRERAIARGILPADSTATGAVLHRVLFAPGFSTRDYVTQSSGRGVGLDAVRTSVEGLGGTVEVETEPGRGTTFILTLPVTLGVLRCLLVTCGDERYAVPLTGVLETVALADSQLHDVAGSTVVVRHGETIPLSDLGEVLGVPGTRDPRIAVVARNGGETVAWAIDGVEGEREVVVKPLGDFLGTLAGTSGATIDSDGGLLLLVDLRELAGRRSLTTVRTKVIAGAPLSPTQRRESAAATATSWSASGSAPRRSSADRASDLSGGVSSTDRPRVLVVEDSVGVRELQRAILESAGYAVSTAVDGLDGAARLQQNPVDLVLSDVEMPGMDGFTLTRTIRKTRGWENVPVIIMTSRGDDADKRAGMDAGADAYLLKSEFDQNALVATVRRLIGR